MKNHRRRLLFMEKKSEYLDPESFYGMKEWISTQTFDIVSKDPSFDIYTNFVCAHEFVCDSRSPPVGATALRSWKPKHTVRIVFTSIAQAMQLAILNLMPSVRPYCVIGADSTYKLTHIRDFKVSGYHSILFL